MAYFNRVAIAAFFLLAAMMLVNVPAFAQIDFSGEWRPNGNEDSIGNPYVGDWLGIPMNDAARARSEAWSASIQTLPEWQCRPHGFAYIYRGPSQLRISKEVDPVTRQITAFHAEWLRSVDVPIYLDGRQHPSADAPHTWGGFNTAEWVGDMLKISTTHVKEEYLRRNGVQHSDLIEITTYWIRRGDILTWVNIVYDPVYLTEPMIRSQEYRLALSQQIPPYPCDVVEEVDRPKGVVPHEMPGTNTFIKEFADKIRVPEAVIRAGAESMYPEIRSKLTGIAHAQQRGQRGGQRNQNAANAEIEILPIRGNLYMLSGAGGNIALSVGPDGVLMVDSGTSQMSDKVLRAVQQLQRQLGTNGLQEWRYASETRSNLPKMISPPAPPKPIRYIINTALDPDHTGGNERLSQAGATITGGNVAGNISDAGTGASIISHENTLLRMNGNQPPIPFRALPTDTYHTDSMKLSRFFNGEGILILHVPSGHTDGDSMVYFRGSDVIVAGDVFRTTGYPVIDIERGGNIQGVIDALNRILDMSIAEFRTEGGTMIVPGHGRLCDSADVAYYRDMVTIIRDRIQDMTKKGMSLEQIKTAKPTQDYDTRYGSTTGSWTTDMFIEAVYHSLIPRK